MSDQGHNTVFHAGVTPFLFAFEIWVMDLAVFKEVEKKAFLSRKPTETAWVFTRRFGCSESHMDVFWTNPPNAKIPLFPTDFDF